MSAKSNRREIVAHPIYREIVSIESFLKMSESARGALKGVRILPPRLGARGFGRIEIFHRSPVFRPRLFAS